MNMDFIGDFLGDLFGADYIGRITYIGYPHMIVDENEIVHYPCTVEILEKHGKEEFFWFYGQVYPNSVYHWYGPKLPIETGE